MPYENYSLQNKVPLAIPEFYLHSRSGSGNLELGDIRATGRNLGWGVGSGFNDAWSLIGQKFGD